MPDLSTESITTETIGDIQNLQSVESELFTALETGINSGTLSADQQTKLVEQINNISNMRMSLYGNINSLFQQNQAGVSNIENVMGQQLDTILIVENELNDAKAKLQELEDEKNNKIRLVEINTYYSEKYNNTTEIMQFIVFISVIFIILSILVKKSILPADIYKVLVIVIAVISIIILWYKIIYVVNRDNMNYDEFNWGPSPNMNYDTSNNSGTNPWAVTTSPPVCAGQECCNVGFTYVPMPTNMCMNNNNLPAGVQPYTSGGSGASYTGSTGSTGSGGSYSGSTGSSWSSWLSGSTGSSAPSSSSTPVIIGVNSQNIIYYATQNITTSPQWVNLPGSLSNISYSNGQVYGVDADGAIFYNPDYTKPTWTAVPGVLTQVSFDGVNNVVMGVNSAGQIFYANQNITTNPNWTGINGNANYVAYSNGQVFALNESGIYYCSNYTNSTTSNWVQIPGALTQISFDGYNNILMGVNSAGQIFYANQNIYSNPNWTQLQGELTNLSYSNGQVYGVNSAGNIYYNADYTTSNWVQMPGGLTQVSFFAG
jgi:uncharacterized membrane protein YgcG